MGNSPGFCLKRQMMLSRLVGSGRLEVAVGELVASGVLPFLCAVLSVVELWLVDGLVESEEGEHGEPNSSRILLCPRFF